MKLSNRIKELIFETRNNNFPNRYLRNIEEFEYNFFIKNITDENFVFNCISKIVSGDVLILRSAASQNLCKKIINYLDYFAKTENLISHKVLNGIKNGYYVSRNIGGSSYQTYDRSFYFFSWNKDETNFYQEAMNLYKPLKILNGLQEDEITNNIPSDGVVERMHIIHYPNGGGEISKHVDPIKFANANFGLYCTQFGIDYDKGGFFVENSQKQKVEIDKRIQIGDLVIFFPGLIHGVDPVFVNKKNQSSMSGRWFCNINLTESHHSKSRETSKGIK
jgi:hypothetical protein